MFIFWGMFNMQDVSGGRFTDCFNCSVVIILIDINSVHFMLEGGIVHDVISNVDWRMIEE